MRTIRVGLSALLFVSLLLVPSASAASTAAGSVVAWGYNFSGQTEVPVGLTGVTAISAGADHSLALAR